MEVLSNRDELLKVLGKYKKEIKLKDGESELTIVMTYPKIKKFN